MTELKQKINWKPVKEKPDNDCDVWLWDGNVVYKGFYSKKYNFFDTQIYGLPEDDLGCGYDMCSFTIKDVYERSIMYGYPSSIPTHWMVVKLPEPPKDK